MIGIPTSSQILVAIIFAIGYLGLHDFRAGGDRWFRELRLRVSAPPKEELYGEGLGFRGLGFRCFRFGGLGV